MFYVYEDWTTEVEPRCFYVGKGSSNRVKYMKRNEQHKSIAKLLGQRRVVVLSTQNEFEAFDIEKKLIAEHHTHARDPLYNGVGCNKTIGGQGIVGRVVSEETRRKISLSKTGKRPNKIWTDAERKATSKRMSKLHKGKKISQDHRYAVSDYLKNRIAAEGNLNAKLTFEQVRHLKDAWKASNFPRRSRLIGPFLNAWAQKLGVTVGCVNSIVKGLRWSSVE